MQKRYSTLVIIAILMFGINEKMLAQDAHFSQFYANSLFLNPAFAGLEKCPKISLNYRNQWPKLSTYSTYSASYDQHLDLLQGGVGLLIMNDVQGHNILKTTTISGMYSYTLPVTRKFYIAGGFQASYIMKSMRNDFIVPEQIHPIYGPIYPSTEDLGSFTPNRNFADFSAGFIGYTDKLFFGLALHHLTQPSESHLKGSDAKLPLKITCHFGTEISINSLKYRKDEIKVAPQLLFSQQGGFQEFNWGLYVSRRSIVSGFWLRQNFNFQYDSFIMLVGFKQDNIRFAYSYDLTVSRLRNATYGAHEVSVAYLFNCRVKNKKFSTISCPSF